MIVRLAYACYRFLWHATFVVPTLVLLSGVLVNIDYVTQLSQQPQRAPAWTFPAFSLFLVVLLFVIARLVRRSIERYVGDALKPSRRETA